MARPIKRIKDRNTLSNPLGYNSEIASTAHKFSIPIGAIDTHIY